MKNLIIILLLTISFSALAQKGNRDIIKGNESYKKGEFAAAETDYNKAIESNNKNSIAYFNKGNALLKQNKFTDAASMYAAAISNSKDVFIQAKAAYNKGVAEAKQQKWQEAADAFKQALKLAPTDKDARENLQMAMNEIKKKQKSQEKPNNNKKKEDKKDDDKKKQQPKMNKDQMENELNKLRNEEKRLQKEMQKKKVQQVSPEKDW